MKVDRTLHEVREILGRDKLYCVTKTHLQTPVPQDNNCGETAVLRNMNALLPPSDESPWRLVVTDCFYTSVTAPPSELGLGSVVMTWTTGPELTLLVFTSHNINISNYTISTYV
ncbi:hypothetical protein PHMEG_00022812, partial [Phytophthora megakarya]